MAFYANLINWRSTLVPAPSPFGQPTRMKVLERYFAGAGEVTAANAWEHVYRCMLWMNESAGLAHIYDSNHMQPGGNFHAKAVRFTDALCARWGIERRELPTKIDVLFKGCVEELRRQEAEAHQREAAAAKLLDDLVGDTSGSSRQDEMLDPSELLVQIKHLLSERGIEDDALAASIESRARDYFTIGKKRNNALGEGFEDLLSILIERAAHVPSAKIRLRTPVSKLPGFRKPPPPPPGQKRTREPTPDIAIVEPDLTHVIVTAKWSMRQDRQQQFAYEFRDFQGNKTQTTELSYLLITNEFDLPRLSNVADASPTSSGGYIFHQIYHINLDLLRETHGGKLGRVEHFIGTGKIRSLENFLDDLNAQFGDKPD